MSLTLALLSSFLAVLGQQWLVQYRKRTGGGVEYQRWEQQRRYLGAKRWQLELILGHALPSLLQISLIIFCAAFVLFLRDLNSSISWAVAALMILVAAIVLGFAICAAWDQWCPFKSPLSQFLQITLPPSFILLGRVTAAGIHIGLATWIRAQRLIQVVIADPRQGAPFRDVSLEEAVESSRKLSEAALMWFRTHSSRPAEHIEGLNVSAIKRLICTSEDTQVLCQAALSLHAYDNREGLRLLLQDDDFLARVRNLVHRSYRDTGYIDRFSTGVLGTASLYVILSEGSIYDLCPREGSVAVTQRTGHQICSQLAYEGKNLICLAEAYGGGVGSSCKHWLELAFWAWMIGTLVVPSRRGELPTAHEFVSEKRIIDNSVKIRCLKAWAIVISKEWVSLQDQDQESQDTWCFEKARSTVELYRQAEWVPRTSVEAHL